MTTATNLGNCEVTIDKDIELSEIWGKVSEPIHALSQAKTEDTATAYLAVAGRLIQGCWEVVEGWDEFGRSTWDFESGEKGIRCYIDAWYNDDDCRIELTLQYEIDGEDQCEVKAVRRFLQ